MIKLTRLRQNTPFILNPDHIERVDTHVDTVVRLTSGTEYLVNETGEEIVRLTAEFRARVISLAGALDVWAVGNALAEAPHAPVAPDASDASTPADLDVTAAELSADTPAEESLDVPVSEESVDAIAPTDVKVAS
jgi:uncharacterized protein YlzI (FlbEa/FlbD family)